MPNRMLKFAVNFDQTKRDLSVFSRLGCRNELALCGRRPLMQRVASEQYQAALAWAEDIKQLFVKPLLIGMTRDAFQMSV